MKAIHRARVLLGAAILGVGFIITPLAAHQAGATLGTCAGCASYDPVVTLSDGTQLRVWVEVQDDVADVQQITYVLHIPHDATVIAISYSGPVPQTLQVAQDSRHGRYDATATVTTGASAVPVILHLDKLQGPTHGNGRAGSQSFHSSTAGTSNSTVEASSDQQGDN